MVKKQGVLLMLLAFMGILVACSNGGETKEIIEDVKEEDIKITESAEPDTTGEPVFIESPYSLKSQPANKSNLQSYKEANLDISSYTRNEYQGWPDFTKTKEKGFYLYAINNGLDDSTLSVKLSKMKRYYLKDGKFEKEFLETEDWFYDPGEDEEGNIYVECTSNLNEGTEPKEKFIKKMNSNGKTLSQIRAVDFETKGLFYMGVKYIKKDIVALMYGEEDDYYEGHVNQLKIIDIKNNKLIKTINFEKNITKTIESDNKHFICVAESYLEVYVFDAETYELVNIIETTKCKELCAFELDLNQEDKADKYSAYTQVRYMVDIKDGKVYFLRHAGVFATECMQSEFDMLLDGTLYKRFAMQQIWFSSFFVGEEDDFYVLGGGYEQENISDFWHFTKVK